jgi:hypothetical protein
MADVPSMPPPPPPGGGGGMPIAPRGLGDLLTAAFEQYKNNIAKLLPVVAAVVVPLSFIGAILTGVVFKPDAAVSVTYDSAGNLTSASVNNNFFATLMGTLVVGMVVAVIISALLQAALVRAAAQAVVGDPVDVESSYKWGFRKIGPVIWISLLVGLIVAGGLILFIIPGIIFAVFLSVAIPALIVENQRGTGALGRSWNLVKGNWWHVLGVIVVAGIITSVVSRVIGAVGGTSWIGIWITGAIAQCVVAPFSALVSVLLYVDLRARTEALTVETLRENISST